jgi:aldose 1-epimerase
LTNQIYFNLKDGGLTSAEGHLLRINADEFLPIDAAKIPRGESKSVRRSPFDFRSLITVGVRINSNDDQNRFGNGYDPGFVLNSTADELSLAAVVFSPASGRVMRVFTTEPGLHFYSGNDLGGVEGKNKRYERAFGICLQPQHFPDSPNQRQ